MGSDKSFDTLLNKYNILLAQTRDLKEQLKNSQEKNQQLLSKFDVVEKNVRELCEDILAKDPKEMKLGIEYSWDKIELLELIRKSKSAFHVYISARKDILERMADLCEERGNQIESLKLQIQKLLEEPTARTLTMEELEKRCNEVKEKEEMMTKLSPKMQEKVASGKIELIETEANDPVINEEMDVVVDAEDMEDELIRKKLMSSSIPGTDHRRTFQAAKSKRKERANNDTKDAYARLIERLSCFSREYSIESKLYGSSEGIAIDDLIGADEVTVLESKGLENTFKNFIFGVITSGFFKFALAHEGGYLADDQYETVLVLEEANEVLTGNDCAGTGGGQNFGMSGQSEFEQILDQSAGYGLFIFAITQKIADMPSSVIANSGLVFAGRLKRTDDINVVVRTVGREERIDDRDLVKWFPRSPTGWFVCQTSRTFDFKDAEPILVQISRLNINPPSNIELDEILIQKKAKTIMSA